jgi:hypothetical protein
MAALNARLEGPSSTACGEAGNTGVDGFPTLQEPRDASLAEENSGRRLKI